MRRRNPRQMRCPSGSCDDDFHAPAFGLADPLRHIIRCAVGGHHFAFVCDAEVCERLTGKLHHGLPIRFGPHHDSNQRRVVAHVRIVTIGALAIARYAACIMSDGNAGDAFELLELRVGKITRVEVNEKARKPSYKLWIDFGEHGERTSSAQLMDLYSAEELPGRSVIAAMNLGGRRIAGFMSEVLVLGLPDAEGRVVLLQPQRDVPPGGRVY